MNRQGALRRGVSDAEYQPRETPRRSYDPARALVGRDATAFALLGLGVTLDGIARHLGIGSVAFERLLLRLRDHFGVSTNAELADLAARHRTETDGG